jgi:putative addiction module killer protein
MSSTSLNSGSISARWAPQDGAHGIDNLEQRVARKATVCSMIEIRKTVLFAQWLDELRDQFQARARVQARIERLAAGNPGDVEPVGEGVSELRINYGPGYRVYFKKRGRELIILLAGGDKTTQAKDIKAALRLARNLSE